MVHPNLAWFSRRVWLIEQGQDSLITKELATATNTANKLYDSGEMYVDHGNINKIVSHMHFNVFKIALLIKQ